MPLQLIRRSRRSAQNRQRSAGRIPRSPPSINATIRFNQTLRFKTLAAVTSQKSVERGDLLNAYLMVINTVPGSMIVARMFHAVKVNRVTIWAVAGAGTDDFDAVDISVTWLSTYGPASVKTDSGNAFNTAAMTTKPPRQSLASYWSLSSSNETDVLFRIGANQTSAGITIPKGFIIDIACSFVCEAVTSVQLNYVSSGSFTTGSVYRSYLGEVGNTTPEWEPVGFNGIY
jgi:hypothetical protein